MSRTKIEAALEALEHEHANDPERAELVRRARRFKASWIELAEALSEVKRTGRWRKWGYASFEEYTKKELLLRQETVDKLTGSYLFLQRRAPDVLRRDGLHAPIPSYQAIDFLRRAEAEEHAPDETLDALRRQVLEEGAPLPTVVKQFRDVVFPIDPEERRARDAATVRNAALRLLSLLEGNSALPKRIAAEVRAALDRLIGALDEKAA